MGAILKTREEYIKEAIEETAKRTAKLTVEEVNAANVSNPPAHETVQPASTASTGGSKVSQILRNANLQQQTDPDIEKERKELTEEREKLKKEREDIEKHKGHSHAAVDENDDLLSCPTCNKTGKAGHVLKSSGFGKVKCTGPNCGIEYGLISTNPDYKCTNCGLPHGSPHNKKPVEQDPDDKCPFCGNDDFLKYDWSKVIKPAKK